jgi:hypothetical protein
MRFYWLVLGTLGAWRISHLLWTEDGPWNIVSRIRVAVGRAFVGNLLDCFYCVSTWVAAPLAWMIGETTPERLLLWPAVSGGAILLERLTERTAPPAQYFEEGDTHHAMLRRTQDPSDAGGGDDTRSS